jgi:E3 ubiquitin-protein ligase DOA10
MQLQQDSGVEDPAKSGSPTRSCRICFGGVEDESELGRLISPCLCSGSMKVSAKSADVSTVSLTSHSTCMVCNRKPILVSSSSSRS